MPGRACFGMARRVARGCRQDRALHCQAEPAGRARELVAHPNYIVVYRVTDDAIEIVNVVHARQKYP